jgi:hypothetical protein
MNVVFKSATMTKFIRVSILVLLTIGALSCIPQNTTKPDENSTWINPGKIQVDKLSPGRSVKHKIMLHNGNQTETGFTVYFREPDYTAEGFAPPPENAVAWININNQSPTLAPNETYEIEITLNVPEKMQLPEHWEFWIGVKQNTQNTVVTELCSRWLVSMKNN